MPRSMEEYNYWGDRRVLAALAGPGWLARHARFDAQRRTLVCDLSEVEDEDLLSELFEGTWTEHVHHVEAKQVFAYDYQVERLRKQGVAEEELQAILDKERYHRHGYVTVPAHDVTYQEWHAAEGTSFIVELPAAYEVCHMCGGGGKVTNPSIDAGGIWGDDEFWRDDIDEETGESRYRRGDYDVTCPTCRGDRVVPGVAERYLDAKQRVLLKWVRNYDNDSAAYAAEVAAERRMGC